MSTIPEFTQVQLILHRVFFRSDKAITIFTEDKPSDKFLYSILLNRLINNEIKINKIIPLGPKSQVVEKSIASLKSRNKSLFIVDCDIKIMFGEELETENLISLKRYCIENYLCCEDGIVEYLFLKLGKERNRIKTDLDFKNFMTINGKKLLKLYYRYLLAFDLNCSHTFKNATEFFNIPGPPKRIDGTKVNQEINNVERVIKENLKNLGNRSYKRELEVRLKKIEIINPINLETIIKVLSGRDQLLPLIRLKINLLDRTSRQLSDDQMKRILADKVNLRSLDFLKQKILSIAK